MCYNNSADKLVGVAHLQSPMHWTEWTETTTYYKDDVVRYPNLKSHQYARCLQDGTSDVKANMPINNITGSIFLSEARLAKTVFLVSAFSSMPRKAGLFLSHRSPTAPILRSTRQERKSKSFLQGFSALSIGAGRWFSARS